MDVFGAIKRAGVAVFAFVSMVAAVNYGSNYTTLFYLAEISERGHATLGLTVAGLRGALSRFEYLPGVIAKNNAIKTLLMSPARGIQVDRANAVLREFATQTGAANILVLDETARIISASRLDREDLADRTVADDKPYYKTAISGGLGRHFAVDPHTGNRGYFFAAPVRSGEETIGMVVVEVDIEAIDSGWISPVHEIVVTDDQGVVFMASRDLWRFRSLRPLLEDDRRAIAKTGRYTGRTIDALNVSRISDLGSIFDLIWVAGLGSGAEYLVQSAKMSDTGWTVNILSKTESARTQAVIFTIIAALLILILVMFLVFLWQRRARLIERIALQREAQDMLERRVEERTESLNRVNKRLVEEIGEREAAEQELRKTQEDLIQAGKLAALGQMSTALSHEFNQPLAAIRTYADNAEILLERGRIREASENVGRIGSLTDRMASISKHLRNFARKPGEKKDAVAVSEAVADTLDLLEAKIRSSDVEVRVDAPADETYVLAGHVRLQQVLVNLIANAIDAMDARTTKVVDISYGPAPDGNLVRIAIRDHGPGFEDGILERIFDPFFTTKEVGQGLGLGLSISFNIIKDFGGTLRATNHPEGGAVFTIALEQAELEQGVAAE